MRRHEQRQGDREREGKMSLALSETEAEAKRDKEMMVEFVSTSDLRIYGRISSYLPASLVSLIWSANLVPNDRGHFWMQFCSFFRIDLIIMSLSRPTIAAGTSANLCNYDKFQVQGQTNKVPEICGNVTDQHSKFSFYRLEASLIYVLPVYLHLDRKADVAEVEVVIRFETVTTVAQDPAVITDPFVHILVTQLDDKPDSLDMAGTVWQTPRRYVELRNCRVSAPNGCLQYFTENVGVVKSFNYDDSLVLDSNTQIANQHYTVCFKKFQFANCVAWVLFRLVQSEMSNASCFLWSYCAFQVKTKDV